MLERAIGHTLGVVRAVTPRQHPNPTPCAAWNLRMLLEHLNDSLEAFQEIVDTQHMGMRPCDVLDDPPVADPAVRFRDRATHLLGSWLSPSHREHMTDIAGLQLQTEIVAHTAAIEIAVHGWDVSQSCGDRRPIPAGLATDMLDIAPMLITEYARQPLFAPAQVAHSTNPSDRLIAFLGRNPDP
ncbi:TIGR03086 family metal-binding protein [Actinomadura sp. NPDC048955]|uniref:TIGR03086 family metal-binding protein n=1 Tax=Actinomadura sp. NPDC048955 TaxID=3158228 RepID=UPI0033FFFDAE